ncbi:MAG: O-antigen ligase family protein [Bacteroidetes bacterium]|nr:O-antigen ligase family protein [Bacteroidota bacterium]
MLILGTIGALPRIVESLSTRQYDQTLGTYLSFQRITGYDEINYPIILVSSFSLLLIAVKKYHKAVLWVVLLISLLALLLSYTRGSWIAAIVGIFFIIFMYTFYSPQQVVKLHTIVFSMFTVVLLIIFFDLLGLLPLDLIFGRATLVTTKQVDISSLERITEWVTAYNDFKKSPLVGAGLGYMVKYYAIGVGYKENIFIHNSYLYVLFKMGIIGFVIFISMYITILKVFFQNIRKFEDIDSFGIYLAFGAIIIVLLIKAFSTWHLNTISNVMFIGILFAAIERYPQFHLKR